MLANYTTVYQMDNDLLFHVTQPTNRSTSRSHCTKQTNHNIEPNVLRKWTSFC